MSGGGEGFPLVTSQRNGDFAFAVYWCIRAQPLGMDGHDAVAYLDKTQIPGVAEGILEGGHRMKLWCSFECVKFGLGTEHCHWKRHWVKKGGKKHVPALSLLINAGLFRLHQDLPCNKARQYVDVLFRAQPLSRKQFPNSWGRDGWPHRAKTGWVEGFALLYACLVYSCLCGLDHSLSPVLSLSSCLSAYALFVFFSWYTHLSLWIRTCTNHKSWNLLPVFESIVLCFMHSVFK